MAGDEAVQGVRLAALADRRALRIGERDGQQVRGLLRADVSVRHFAHDVVRLAAGEVLPPLDGVFDLADGLVAERAELTQDIQLADRLDELAALVAVAPGVLEVHRQGVQRLLELARLFGRSVRSEPHRMPHVAGAKFSLGRNLALALFLVGLEPSLRAEVLAQEQVELFAHRLLLVADALRVYERAQELHLREEPGDGRHVVQLRDAAHGRLAAAGVGEVADELRIDALRRLAEELHGHEVAPHVGVLGKPVFLDPLAPRELGDEPRKVARVLQVERGFLHGLGQRVAIGSFSGRGTFRLGAFFALANGGLVLGVAPCGGLAVLAVLLVRAGLLAGGGHDVVHDGLHLCVDLDGRLFRFLGARRTFLVGRSLSLACRALRSVLLRKRVFRQVHDRLGEVDAVGVLDRAGVKAGLDAHGVLHDPRLTLFERRVRPHAECAQARALAGFLPHFTPELLTHGVWKMFKDEGIAHATSEVVADALGELLRAGHDALRLDADLRCVPVWMQTAHHVLHRLHLHGPVGHLVRLAERDPRGDGSGNQFLVAHAAKLRIDETGARCIGTVTALSL